MVVQNQMYDEERALYGVSGAQVIDCTFDGPADGESALKESDNIIVRGSRFYLRYPLWHTTNAKLYKCEMNEKCRAAMWYDRDISLDECDIMGIKALRECDNVSLKDCRVSSAEFSWRCRSVKLDSCSVESEYPFFECRDMEIDSLKMKAKYSFQYVENATIKNSQLDTKDAFWHCKNITVTDSVIKGEYLGWYSENLRLARCHIIGTQPLCYCKGLVLEDCVMESADLSFEKSEVSATVIGAIDSIKNPTSGSITADSIGEIILDEKYCCPQDCKIIVRQNKRQN